MQTAIYMGMMSGTSLDAVDAVLVSFPAAGGARLLASHSRPWPAPLRDELLALCQPGADELRRLARLDAACGDFFAQVAGELMQQQGLQATAISAIACHGQTIRHEPALGHSLQIGDPNRIAEACGCTVVADFRRRDLAAGGQGAPLVPAFHAAMLRAPGEHRCVVNIGGMANLTWLDADSTVAVLGYDTGPGNVLIDGWMQSRHGLPYDPDGRYARGGRVDAGLLGRLLAHPYFQQEPPKSTGRESFNLSLVDNTLAQLPQTPEDADILRTLTYLSARSIADGVLRHGSCGRLILCGGGQRNSLLCEDLAQALPGFTLHSSAEWGIDPQWMEAMAFAWLGQQRLQGQPGNMPSVTGAQGPRCLGAVYSA